MLLALDLGWNIQLEANYTYVPDFLLSVVVVTSAGVGREGGRGPPALLRPRRAAVRLWRQAEIPIIDVLDRGAQR